ncbi:hypothetical protein Egran_02924 [Elaphomyces granulatus]|uniref:Ubiquitin carboxyl-terminal hydrolase n=1 Tax=Elaphomyces granulatus TaxID=519963 RepID=A0A232LYR9_9EURO|nr:hypothetical protein Egran_02924 [Elaphomyces granulatus]
MIFAKEEPRDAVEWSNGHEYGARSRFMPDRPATVAAYAAGASLAAITLFYVFGPNFTIDGENSSDTDRKKAIVGLSNPANDCFVNSVLQALAGLLELRLYLNRELHRRKVDGLDIYDLLPGPEEIPPGQKAQKLDRIRELQQGTVTRALKEMLDRLNERPIYKKTISARHFIEALEYAFRTRISRNQQDAQEFFQVVAERLCDEHHAGIRARQRAKKLVEISAPSDRPPSTEPDTKAYEGETSAEVAVETDKETGGSLPQSTESKLMEGDTGSGFPFEGQLESQIECQFCRYQYRPNKTSFVNLTLQVPQESSTTLSSCFDGLLKTEYIDDFRCDNCRLQHALEIKILAKAKTPSEKEANHLEMEISRIQEALRTDPERPLEGIVFPAAELVPKRKIARYMRITVFPKIIAIHLSRSIFDRSSSTKNAARVSFPERLALGGILDRQWYKLLGIVCHKGSHNSGHYESFRRSHLHPPFSTPDVFRSYAQTRAASENPSVVVSPSPSMAGMKKTEPSPLSISPAVSSPSLSSSSSSSAPVPSTSNATPPPSAAISPRPPTSSLPTTPAPASASTSMSSPRASLQTSRSRPSTSQGASAPMSESKSSSDSVASSARIRQSKSISPMKGPAPPNRLLRRNRKPHDRWWRISDDKVKQCQTSDVLGMQKEVYLLFYEMEPPNPASGTPSPRFDSGADECSLSAAEA